MKFTHTIRYLTLLFGWIALLVLFQIQPFTTVFASPLTKPANRITDDLQQLHYFTMVGDENISIFLPLIHQGGSGSDSDSDESTSDDSDTGESDSDIIVRTAATIARTSPLDGEDGVALTRETFIEFDAPIDPTTVTKDAFIAFSNGATLPARLHVSPDNTRVTLFYNDPLPASSRVRIVINGDMVQDQAGRLIDFDGDGVAGGQSTIDFDTNTLASDPGTSVCGTVYASELAQRSRSAANVPLQGVTITVDGMEETLHTTSDSTGSFCLDPAPAGRFFVHINGRTVTNGVPSGAYYPSVGKAWESVEGQQTDVGDVYLPLVPEGTLQAVSESEETEIHFAPSVLADHPEFADVKLTVPADSLYSDDGTRGGMVGIAPVAPDRLPGQLPEYLNFPIVITVQTDGATNFDEPVPVCFPNLPDPDSSETLGVGEKSALFSFNHDTGKWGVMGSMTVTSDGQLVCTDPGVGIEAPGWHGSQSEKFVLTPISNAGTLHASDGNPAPGAGNIESPGAKDIYTFRGGAIASGQAVFAAATIVGTLGEEDARWQLVDEDGQEIFDAPYANVNFVYLEYDVVYTLTVSGNRNKTGIYSFYINDYYILGQLP